MPTPMLKVLNMSRSGMFPLLAMKSKMAGIRREAFSIFAPSPSGMERGMFSYNPPPVIWETPWTSTASSSASTGLT